MLTSKIRKTTIGMLIVLLLPLCGAAQPVIDVAPSPVLFGNRPGAQNYTEIINRGNQPLTVDSLRFSSATAGPYGWLLDLVLPDTTFDYLYFAFGTLDWPVFPDVSIASGDTATIHFLAWDACIVCKASDDFGWPVLDTLFVFNNDPATPTVSVPIDFTFYVGIDRSPPYHQFALGIYPNPAADWVTFEFQTPEPGHVQITVLDVLGRRVLVPVDGIYGSGRHRVDADLNNLAAGVYTARIEAHRVSGARSFVVVSTLTGSR